jgi:cytochrome oxidase assembly protein ShyY1
MATDPAEPTSRRVSMYRFLLKPKWIAFHLLVIAVIVVMINLAFWQLRRLDERREFNSQVRANANQPINPISDVLTPAIDPSTVEWRRVRATGTYVPGHQFLVVNRSQNGETGRNVVDAMQLADGSLLLINRGFAPNGAGTPATPAGVVEVVGRLRLSERRTTGQLSDDGSGVLSEIRRIDVGLLAGQFDTTVQPMYVERLEATPADAAALQPIVAPMLDEGPHLSYTIQWFFFSGCVIAGWVLAVRRSVK